jgi:hypothetical protein
MPLSDLFSKVRLIGDRSAKQEEMNKDAAPGAAKQ